MAEDSALFRLLAWLSPAYPVGAFSYSHGLEAAIEAGMVADAGGLEAWLVDELRHGAGRNDGLLFAAAHAASRAADASGLREIAETALAFQAAAELVLETTAQGCAFFAMTAAIWPCPALDRLRRAWPGRLAYPVSVAAAAEGHGIPLAQGLTAYLHAFAANLVSAGVRLVPLGQTEGQKVIAALEPVVAELRAAILREPHPLAELASNTVLTDWCAMRHETQYTRLFRS